MRGLPSPREGARNQDPSSGDPRTTRSGRKSRPYSRENRCRTADLGGRKHRQTRGTACMFPNGSHGRTEQFLEFGIANHVALLLWHPARDHVDQTTCPAACQHRCMLDPQAAQIQAGRGITGFRALNTGREIFRDRSWKARGCRAWSGRSAPESQGPTVSATRMQPSAIRAALRWIDEQCCWDAPLAD